MRTAIAIALLFLWAAVIITILMWLSGCATVKLDLPDGTRFESATLFKDVAIDPNGVVSATSEKAEGIIGALAGLAAGLLIGK